jgi:hypothetical protein
VRWSEFDAERWCQKGESKIGFGKLCKPGFGNFERTSETVKNEKWNPSQQPGVPCRSHWSGGQTSTRPPGRCVSPDLHLLSSENTSPDCSLSQFFPSFPSMSWTYSVHDLWSVPLLTSLRWNTMLFTFRRQQRHWCRSGDTHLPGGRVDVWPPLQWLRQGISIDDKEVHY